MINDHTIPPACHTPEIDKACGDGGGGGGPPPVAPECAAAVMAVPECAKDEMISACLGGNMSVCKMINDHTIPPACHTPEIDKACGDGGGGGGPPPIPPECAAAVMAVPDC